MDCFVEMLTAMGVGLPLLEPYLGKNSSKVDEGKGINFAVAGSTAVESSFLLSMGVVAPLPSLTVQLAWFNKYINSAYSTPTGTPTFNIFRGVTGSRVTRAQVQF